MSRPFATAAHLIAAGFVNIANSRVYTHPDLAGLWFFPFMAGENSSLSPGLALLRPADGTVVFSSGQALVAVNSVRASQLAKFTSPDQGASFPLAAYWREASRLMGTGSSMYDGWYGYNQAVVREANTEYVFDEAQSVQFGMIVGSCQVEGYLFRTATLDGQNAIPGGIAGPQKIRGFYQATAKLGGADRLNELVAKSIAFAAKDLPDEAIEKWLPAALKFAGYVSKDPNLGKGLATVINCNGNLSVPLFTGASVATAFKPVWTGTESLDVADRGADYKYHAPRNCFYHRRPYIQDGVQVRLTTCFETNVMPVGSIGRLMDAFADSLLGFATRPTGGEGATLLGPDPNAETLPLTARDTTVALLSETQLTQSLKSQSPVLAIVTDAIGYADAFVGEFRFMPVFSWLFTFQPDFVTPVAPSAYGWTNVPSAEALQALYGDMVPAYAQALGGAA